MTSTVHATCVLLGNAGVLIRGPSGVGKSRLALALLDDAERGGRFARLVADDRVHLKAMHGRLIAGVPEALGGMIERRGFGIERRPFEPAAVVALAADLVDRAALARMPEEASGRVSIKGVEIGRIEVLDEPQIAVGLVRAALARCIAATGSLGKP